MAIPKGNGRKEDLVGGKGLLSCSQLLYTASNLLIRALSENKPVLMC